MRVHTAEARTIRISKTSSLVRCPLSEEKSFGLEELPPSSIPLGPRPRVGYEVGCDLQRSIEPHRLFHQFPLSIQDLYLAEKTTIGSEQDLCYFLFKAKDTSSDDSTIPLSADLSFLSLRVFTERPLPRLPLRYHNKSSGLFLHTNSQGSFDNKLNRRSASEKDIGHMTILLCRSNKTRQKSPCKISNVHRRSHFESW